MSGSGPQPRSLLNRLFSRSRDQSNSGNEGEMTNYIIREHLILIRDLFTSPAHSLEQSFLGIFTVVEYELL